MEEKNTLGKRCTPVRFQRLPRVMGYKVLSGLSALSALRRQVKHQHFGVLAIGQRQRAFGLQRRGVAGL